MLRTKRYVRKQAKALTRRRLNAQERHERQQKQAQRDIEALHQALHDLGLPDNLVTEIDGRLRTQKKLLGKIFGLMFPTLFGCINADFRRAKTINIFGSSREAHGYWKTTGRFRNQGIAWRG